MTFKINEIFGHPEERFSFSTRCSSSFVYFYIKSIGNNNSIVQFEYLTTFNILNNKNNYDLHLWYGFINFNLNNANNLCRK